MRGKEKNPEKRNHRLGITPAYAGKSCYDLDKLHGRWDHPRVCGEKFPCLLRLSIKSGSPPRMRGKGYVRSCDPGGSRITPAYAGKSIRSEPSPEEYRDHPRVCGEKFLLHLLHHWQQGSPPRMRGKAGTPCPSYRHRRITPAYAGKREGIELKDANKWDHPRVCGEKFCL